VVTPKREDLREDGGHIALREEMKQVRDVERKKRKKGPRIFQGLESNECEKADGPAAE